MNLFPGKLKMKWSGPFEVIQVYPSRFLDINDERGGIFKVNMHRVKHYYFLTQIGVVC
ncbi:hypothetical protein ACS0TY_035212 [Phlomoides rotata]